MSLDQVPRSVKKKCLISAAFITSFNFLVTALLELVTYKHGENPNKDLKYRILHCKLLENAKK